MEMRGKARKSTGRVVATDQSHKKMKTENILVDQRDGTGVLTASSSSSLSQKRKAALNLTSSSQKSYITQATSICTHSFGQSNDTCHGLRLAFSNVDGSSGDAKGVPAANMFFSPVFHLSKGFKGETSNSHVSSVEKADSLYNKPEDAQTKVDLHKDSRCSEATNVSVSSCIREADDDALAPMPVVERQGALPLHIEHTTPFCSSTDEDIFGSQAVFDVGEICPGWSFGDENRESLQSVGHFEDGLLDSEGASLFLAVQQSKALDHSCRNSHTEAATEDDLNDFDPYLFIKQLPELSEVLSPGRSPALLPKQTRRSPPVTLVLDLDETLVHSSLEYCENADFTFTVKFLCQDYKVYVRRRPHLQMFMEKVAQMFEIIVFTASQSVYAERLLNVLDPKRKLIRHRMFRDSCVLVDGNYLKDLSVLGRDLAKVAIIDNSPQAFGFQVDNGIPIKSWYDDQSDCGLLSLLPFLETLAGVEDVRPIISRKFNLRQKIAAAKDPLSIGDVGNPLDWQ